MLSDDGVIEHSLQTLSVITTPADIPTHITVDISDLAVGDVVRVGDLVLPRGVTAAIDPDTPVVVAAGAAVEEEPVAEEGEEVPKARATRAPVPPRAGPTPRVVRRHRWRTSSSSGWATRARSTPAPVTTWAPRWWPSWPPATAAG